MVVLVILTLLTRVTFPLVGDQINKPARSRLSDKMLEKVLSLKINSRFEC